MAHQLLLYISAGSDLNPERELLGRAIAEIPLDLGWRLYQTPRSGQRVDREAIELADIHLFLLGGDVRAPIGYEWDIARQAGRRPLPFLRQGISRTPAAGEFLRYLRFQSPWFAYRALPDLRRRVLRLLALYLQYRATDLGLSVVEIETLANWRKTLAARPVDDDTIGGAGEGGVLLSRSRHVPLDGVLVDPQTAADQVDDGPWPDLDLDWLDLDALIADEDAPETPPA